MKLDGDMKCIDLIGLDFHVIYILNGNSIKHDFFKEELVERRR